jgi:hypothetical protein
VFVKDPSAVLDYTIDWTAWLVAGDTIVAATWTPSSGISIPNLTAPTGLATTPSTTGGTLAASTYYYVISAIDQNGETTKSNEGRVLVAPVQERRQHITEDRVL